MKKVLLVGGAGLILVSILVAVWGEKTRTVGKITSEKMIYPTIAPDSIVDTYQGRFFDLVYSSELELRKDNEMTVGEEKIELLGGEGDSRHVVVAIKPTTEITAEDLSGVKMRRFNPRKYQSETVKFLGADEVEFSNLETFEKVVIAIRNGKQISVAMTANSNDPALESDFENVLLGFTLK